MTTGMAATDWPSNMCAEDRKVWLHEQIRNWVGEKRIEECLSALELGNLSMTEKAVAYRSVLIVGGIKHCRKHKRVEARIPILTLITYLSDNAKGTCFLSIAKMAEAPSQVWWKFLPMADFSGEVERIASGGQVNWLSQLPAERAPAVDLSQPDLA